MLEIYRAYRDPEYMIEMGRPPMGVWAAIIETVLVYRFLRAQCKTKTHIRLDVWDDQCWHRRKEARIGHLDDRRVWGNPDIVWSAEDADPYFNGEFMVTPETDEVDYHYWRHG